MYFIEFVLINVRNLTQHLVVYYLIMFSNACFLNVLLHVFHIFLHVLFLLHCLKEFETLLSFVYVWSLKNVLFLFNALQI